PATPSSSRSMPAPAPVSRTPPARPPAQTAAPATPAASATSPAALAPPGSWRWGSLHDDLHAGLAAVFFNVNDLAFQALLQEPHELLGFDGLLRAAHLEGVLGNEPQGQPGQLQDRKSTRLNSSHVKISYAVFCLKK